MVLGVLGDGGGWWVVLRAEHLVGGGGSPLQGARGHVAMVTPGGVGRVI